MRRIKKATGLFAYLEKLGRLEAEGDELKALIKAYRREYEKQFKRDYRSKHKQYTVSFTPAETKKISLASKEHNLKNADFIKRATLAYLDTTYVVQHKETVDKILQTLLRYQTAILRAEEGQKGSWFKSGINRDLEQAVSDIQNQVSNALKNPPLLIDLIKIALKERSGFKAVLQTLIADHECT